MRVFSLSAAELLERIIASGAHIRLVGDELQIKIKGGVDPELREEIWRNKNGLTELVQAGEHKWGKVEEWEFEREGNRMIGKRLDAPGEMSWEVKPSAPLEKTRVLQS